MDKKLCQQGSFPHPQPLPTKWGGVSSLAMTGRGIYKELLVIVIYKSHELASPLPPAHAGWGGVSSLVPTMREGEENEKYISFAKKLFTDDSLTNNRR